MKECARPGNRTDATLGALPTALTGPKNEYSIILFHAADGYVVGTQLYHAFVFILSNTHYAICLFLFRDSDALIIVEVAETMDLIGPEFAWIISSFSVGDLASTGTKLPMGFLGLYKSDSGSFLRIITCFVCH